MGTEGEQDGLVGGQLEEWVAELERDGEEF